MICNMYVDLLNLKKSLQISGLTYITKLKFTGCDHILVKVWILTLLYKSTPNFIEIFLGLKG